MTASVDLANDMPEGTHFFSDLMANIMEGVMIPKVQIERAVGPIIGFFLADVLSKQLKQEIVMLCPEFPIRKGRIGITGTDSNQSTNIDWLMFNVDRNELVFVELKTTDTTFKREQADIYKRLLDAIKKSGSAEFLYEDIEEILDSSSEGGKYRNVLTTLEGRLLNVRGRLEKCNSAQVVYMAPEATKPSYWEKEYGDWMWFSFKDLPKAIDHRHADYWPIVHNSLLELDGLSRHKRNGTATSTPSEKNYANLYRFDELLTHCRRDSDGIVIGLTDWKNSLPAMSLEQLRGKTFKCDSRVNGVGKKVEKNWISGRAFLSQVEKLLK